MHQPLRLLVSAALVAVLFAAPAVRAQSTGALKKIKDSGEMTIGYRDSSIPFSYLGADAQPVGTRSSSAAASSRRSRSSSRCRPQCQHAGGDVAEPDPVVANGTVTLECGSTVNNVERQAQVAFSDTRSSWRRDLSPRRRRTTDDRGPEGQDGRVHDRHQHNQARARAEHRAQPQPQHHRRQGPRRLDAADDERPRRGVLRGHILLVGMAAASAEPQAYALSTEGYSVDPYALMFARTIRSSRSSSTDARLTLCQRRDQQDLRQVVRAADPAEERRAQLPDGRGAEEGDRPPHRLAEPADYK
jgi:glutamate/aspartate transport system substrate-binding protein